ncbi:MAG TPA: DUF1570 domain-containing protein [Caulifigura sp.]|jgi:hypothetical protein|nr:DUF1570 domain-containing protein [Caulifigura sp.]
MDACLKKAAGHMNPGFFPCSNIATRKSHRSWLLEAGVLTVLFFSGCATHRGQSLAELPAKHSVRAERLVIHSDAPIGKESPIITELAELKLDILSTLNLPESKRPVVVYLFRDERRYTEYMRQKFPNLPVRRAFFVGTTSELAVYAYHGDNLATDLRHEYTHGVLHSSLKNLPLWLDEGLAEYFEPPRDRKHVNEEHVSRLTAAIQGGWQPDLVRLEQLTGVSEMQAMDYHEAWAWTYTMLQSDNGDAAKLVEYVQACKDGSPIRLSQTMASTLTAGKMQLLKKIASLDPATAGDAVIPAGFERPEGTGKATLE